MAADVGAFAVEQDALFVVGLVLAGQAEPGGGAQEVAGIGGGAGAVAGGVARVSAGFGGGAAGFLAAGAIGFGDGDGFGIGVILAAGVAAFVVAGGVADAGQGKEQAGVAVGEGLGFEKRQIGQFGGEANEAAVFVEGVAAEIAEVEHFVRTGGWVDHQVIAALIEATGAAGKMKISTSAAGEG